MRTQYMHFFKSSMSLEGWLVGLLGLNASTYRWNDDDKMSVSYPEETTDLRQVTGDLGSSKREFSSREIYSLLIPTQVAVQLLDQCTGCCNYTESNGWDLDMLFPRAIPVVVQDLVSIQVPGASLWPVTTMRIRSGFTKTRMWYTI